MSQGGMKERKTLGAAKGSTPFKVESINDGAHRRQWSFLPRNYTSSINVEYANLFEHNIQSLKMYRRELFIY